MFRERLKVIERFAKLLLADLLSSFIKAVGMYHDRGNILAGIVPPASPGSLGDEAMVLALTEGLSKTHKLALLEYPGESSWSARDLFVDYSTYKMPLGLWGFLEFIKKPRFDRIYIVGADIIDGAYSFERATHLLQFARFASRLGVDVTVTGCSISKKPIASQVYKSMKRLPKSVRFCARDPKSEKRFAEILNIPIITVADLAFQIKPELKSAADKATYSFISRYRQSDRIIVGICPSMACIGIENISESEKVKLLVKSFTNIILQMTEALPESYFVLLHHDYRGELNDLEICRKIVSSVVDQQDQPKVFFEASEYTPMGIKYLCTDLDLVISCRMHCGIASLGAGTPCVFVDYNDKAEGLLDYYSMDSVTTFVNDAGVNCRNILKIATELLAKRGAIRKSLNRAESRITKLSFDNY